MSGDITTTRDQYVEVLGMHFNPDAAPSSANMITDLGPSKNLLTCDLTKAVLWYRPSPGEGKPDCRSLSGRLDWSEEIANPSPLDGQSNLRAKWVGKTGFLRSRHTTACVELSSAVHSKTSEIGVGDAPRAFSLLVSHLCTCTRGRSVGAFSSVRRAGRLRIANGHTGNRVSDIHEGPLGCRGTNFTASSTRVQARRVMSLQRPTATFSDAERIRSRSTRCCRPDRRDVVSRPIRVAPKDSLLGSKQGDPWVPGTSQEPMGFRGKADVVRPYLFAGPAGSDRLHRRPSRAVHRDDRSRLT
jgi:hypothetical protein